MAFQKGQSGNPGGRPKAKLADGRTVQEIAREHTDLAIKTLAAIMRSGESDAARVAAANSVLDRAWGRPAQAVELAGKGGGPIRHIDVTKLTEAELAALETVATLVGDDEAG